MPLLILDGRRLRELRWRRGFTLEELAREVGLRRQTLQRAEAGLPVVFDTMRKICGGLGLGVRQRSQLIADVIDTGAGFRREQTNVPEE